MSLAPLDSATSGYSSELTGLAVRSAQSPVAQRKAVAAQFEAIMLRELLTQSVGSMMGGDKDAQGSIYGYFLTDSLAQKLSAEGGMGLANVIAQQLTPKGQAAAPASAAASAYRAPGAPAP